MNLLFVNNIPFNPVAGGIERVTDILAKELMRRGYTIFYLCGKLDTDSSDLLNYDFPAKLYQLPEDGLFNNEHNLQFYKKLQKELGIDIVINQRGLGGWFNGLLPFTDSKLISVLHSVADSAIKQLPHSLRDSSAPPFLKIKRLVKTFFPFAFIIYWRRKITFDLRAKYYELARHSDAIVTLSNKDIDIFNNYVPNGLEKIVHSIGNPNSFRNHKTESFKKKRKIILYIGRLEKFDKSPLRLLKIWRYLYVSYPEWQLKIVGDGHEKSAMEFYVKKHNLTNVFFEGQKKVVSKYYEEASFVCLTSNFEGWGMALTEGMQYGCIPFTFNNYGAASDIIDDTINGRLIAPFKLRQYAKALSELMNDTPKRIAMSKAAIKKVENFSSENIANKWEEIFLELR